MRGLLFLFLFIPALCPAETSCIAREDSCELYLCKEKEMSCGPRGYWLGYGHPYCERFLIEEWRFSPVCQAWLRNVRGCLQEQAGELSAAESCGDLRRSALHGHIDCYVRTGFCDLSGRDQLQVLWMLRHAVREPETWRESYLLARACSARSSRRSP